MVAASATSPLAVLGSGSLTAYWRFQRAVAAAQLQAWLPTRGRTLLDISGPQSSASAQAAASGYRVIRVIPPLPAVPAPLAGEGRRDEVAFSPTRREQKGSTEAPSWRRGGEARRSRVLPEPALGAERRAGGPGGSPPRINTVLADPVRLSFLADGTVDGVIAEDGVLSAYLMAEDIAAEISRVLRPGGQVLACVDSLVLGMSILAEQHHWAELTDLPQAEVVLIPWPDGRITRCFGPEQLGDLLTEAGLEVSWIRPRTVLSPSMVDHVLRKEPGAIMRLVRAEMAAGQQEAPAAGGSGSFGMYLLAAARKPG
jgi:Methyltransferase domain